MIESIDTESIVVVHTELDALLDSWHSAARQARAAYGEWGRRRDAESYAAYRACADRADAAQDALAAFLTA